MLNSDANCLLHVWTRRKSIVSDKFMTVLIVNETNQLNVLRKSEKYGQLFRAEQMLILTKNLVN